MMNSTIKKQQCPKQDDEWHHQKAAFHNVRLAGPFQVSIRRRQSQILSAILLVLGCLRGSFTLRIPECLKHLRTIGQIALRLSSVMLRPIAQPLDKEFPSALTGLPDCQHRVNVILLITIQEQCWRWRLTASIRPVLLKQGHMKDIVNLHGLRQQQSVCNSANPVQDLERANILRQ